MFNSGPAPVAAHGGNGIFEAVDAGIRTQESGEIVRVVTIAGARPQFIKAAAMSRELRLRHEEILVHTGQHYDYEMSGVFFDGLELPEPDVNLGVGSAAHGAQTGAMLRGIEEVLTSEQPDWVLIYGDTNSTLAGALAAAKIGIPAVHVEAGLRSFNRRMPEEINRVVTDRLSALMLCPSETAVQNLAAEGITQNVHLVGDVMLDILNWARQRSEMHGAGLLRQFGFERGGYLVATVHRGENTDDPARLGNIVRALNRLEESVLFPVHPRTRKAIAALGIRLGERVHMIDPVGYIEMVALVESARMVLTDSGGLQKESYWLGVPCVTLRMETEWVETVAAGWNVLVGSSEDDIVATVNSFVIPASRPRLYGHGGVPAACIGLIESSERRKGNGTS